MKRHDFVSFTETLNMEPYVYNSSNGGKGKLEISLPWMPLLLGGQRKMAQMNENPTSSGNR
jgi:hypothetical protein